MAGADPDMSYELRAELMSELCPGLPGAAVRRIGYRTATSADLFAVAKTPWLAALRSGKPDSQVLAVDAVMMPGGTGPNRRERR